MRIVICGAGSAIGAALAARLAAEHDVLFLDHRDPVLDFGEWLAVEEWSTAALTPLLAGADALVHAGLYAAETLSELDGDQALLDVGGRLTWHLQQAAKDAAVRRMVYLSSLELVADYDPELWVTPDFEPRPTEAPRQLGFHLLECLAKEARREYQAPIRVARLGTLVRAAEVDNAAYDRLWIDFDDAVTVLAAMVTAEEPQGRGSRSGGVLHLCADRPDAISQPRGLRRWLNVELAQSFGYQAPAAEAQS